MRTFSTRKTPKNGLFSGFPGGGPKTPFLGGSGGDCSGPLPPLLGGSKPVVRRGDAGLRVFCVPHQGEMCRLDLFLVVGSNLHIC